MCHALRVRPSPVMAARVRLKIRRGIGVSPIVVLIAVCAVSSLVSGMFKHRHCDHQHPRAHEVSSFTSIAKGDSNLSSLYTTTLIIAAVFSSFAQICMSMYSINVIFRDRFSFVRYLLIFSCLSSFFFFSFIFSKRVFNLVEGNIY